MYNSLLKAYPQIAAQLKPYESYWKEVYIEPKNILLHEGAVSKSMYFIVNGAMRLYSNMNGKEITLQFFFENSFVASIESFLKETPSQFTIETIEACKVLKIEKELWKRILAENPQLKEKHFDITTNRFMDYINHLLAFIQQKPEQRYFELLKNKPYILQRVPLQYIASYLGITTVSLSRIRGRIRI
ncbi:Crp/Fnr family transcriptional regulator [Flavobacterium sp.]|uniref:Crp/Fnr family transcriptional regulator n=1 Tax=Flavobacterium sp. TaxID=239 RepID=UPI003D0BB454